MLLCFSAKEDGQKEVPVSEIICKLCSLPQKLLFFTGTATSFTVLRSAAFTLPPPPFSLCILSVPSPGLTFLPLLLPSHWEHSADRVSAVSLPAPAKPNSDRDQGGFPFLKLCGVGCSGKEGVENVHAKCDVGRQGRLSGRL